MAYECVTVFLDRTEAYKSDLKLKIVLKSKKNSFIGGCKIENVFSSIQFWG